MRGMNRFLSFCAAFNITNPFLVSESLLCYFVAYLAGRGISPATIKTYLAATCNTQILRGHPELLQSSSLLHLHLIQSGVRRESTRRGPSTTPCLPMTPSILGQIQHFCAPITLQHDWSVVWAAMTVCFFGFFRA